MLKVLFNIKRLPHFSHAQFDIYWKDRHAPLVRANAETLGIRRYVQTATLDMPQAQSAIRASRGGLNVEFDGSAELWWDDMEAHLSPRNTPEGRKALEILIQDERRFIDFTQSQIWYAIERVIL